MKIGIVTYHRAINNGAILQAKGLFSKLSKEFPECEIEFINYSSFSLELYEFLKCFKLFKNKYFFNLRRYLIFTKFTPRFLQISSRKYSGNLNKVIKTLNYSYNENDVVITGSDCIWKLSKKRFLPSFPNLFWLPNKIKSKKFSYAASAYQYDRTLFESYKGQIKKYLTDYGLISVRDEDTYNMIESLNLQVPIHKVPDPAFFYNIEETNVAEKLKKLSIDTEKPILALISNYVDIQIEQTLNYYRERGYQIIGLSMYSSLVDINLGDELNPAEWAEVFKYIDFCVTDRFHGAIFCMKNKTPFLAIESKNTEKERSKKYQLLKDFQILDCYSSNWDACESQEIINQSIKIINNRETIVKSIQENYKNQMAVTDNIFSSIRKLINHD